MHGFTGQANRTSYRINQSNENRKRNMLKLILGYLEKIHIKFKESFASSSLTGCSDSMTFHK